MRAASLRYVFEYVLSDVRDGGKPYRTTGTCRVEGGPVGLRRAGHQSWGASLRRLPYFSVLLLPALVGSLPVVVWRLRVLSRGASGAADSADLKNLLLKKRVACDRRRSESRQPRFEFYRERITCAVALLQQIFLVRECCCGNIKKIRGSVVWRWGAMVLRTRVGVGSVGDYGVLSIEFRNCDDGAANGGEDVPRGVGVLYGRAA